MSDELYQALESDDVLCPILLAELDFESGPVRAWTGYGDLVWNGKTFKGTGLFGEFSSPRESSGLRANTQIYKLNNIPSDMLAIILGERYQGRSARLWLSLLDNSTGAMIGEPYMLANGRMDAPTIEDNGNTGSITITAESILIDLERPRERRFTHEDQQDLYPGDKFFEFVPDIQNREIVWK